MNKENAVLDDGRDESANERADRNWNELMQELRVMQTGAQVLTGFLLAIAFQSRFPELDQGQVAAYVALVALAALATILSISPVVLHRVLFREGRKAQLVTYSSRIVSAELVIIAMLTVGVTTFIIDVAVGLNAALVAFVVTTVVVLLLWVVTALFARKRRR